MRPVSPYALSKTYQDMAAQLYYKIYGLNIIITRMFTYVNPRKIIYFNPLLPNRLSILKIRKIIF